MRALAPRPGIARHRFPKAATALAMLLLVGGCLAGCGSSGADASGGGPTITLYNAQHEQTTDALIAAFTKQTGIHVVVKNDDEDLLTAQIEQEGSHSPADVFYTENSNWLQQLADRGLLAKIDTSTLGNVPASDSAADGDWVGVSARVSVLVYNPSKITPAQLPQSILDMADPRYHGEFELAPAETDFWPLVVSVAKAEGEPAALAWLKGLESNAGSAIVPDNETLVSDVSKGITDFGVVNHYYYYRLSAEAPGGTLDARLASFVPRDPGYLETVSGAAVLKSSTHQQAAQEFVRFITSKAGQDVLEQGESFEYPLAPGVAANPKLPPLASYRPNGFSPADLGTGDVAKTLMQQAGLL